MNNTLNRREPVQDEVAVNETEAPSAQSRRALLGGTARYFAVAASGLLLPPGVEEAAARDGALGGAKGGRRGKNQRGRNRKRTHGDKKENNKDQDKPRGFGLSGIDFTILVESTHGKTLDLQYYSASDPFGNYKVMGGNTISSDGKQTGFNTVSTRAFVWINNRYFIEAINPLAALLEGKMGHGGRIDSSGWHDGTLVTSGPWITDSPGPSRWRWMTSRST